MNFTNILHLLGQIYALLVTGSSCTKRELYYKNQELFPDQLTSDSTLNDISCMLNCPLWDLGVNSSPKGLVAGHLTLVYVEKEVVYDTVKGHGVPADLSNIKKLSSCAKFMLIVEKDTVFQRLLDDHIFDKLEKEMILITVSRNKFFF